MDVSRVNSTRVDSTEPSERQSRPEVRAERPERSRPPEEKIAASEPQPVSEAVAPKPVVNTSGQTTGTRINTSA